MPATSPLATPDLKFDVAAPAGWSYSAGDTIIGCLIRHTPIVTPEATIVLTLIGRIKTKITNRTNSAQTHYRSECILVKSEQPVIACQPLHLPDNSGTPLSWEFAVSIPTEPLRTAGKKLTPMTSYVPLDKDHPAHHTLPGSFISSSDAIGISSTGFVEYYLKARLRYTHKGSNKEVEAIWPFTLSHPVEYASADQLSKLSSLSCYRQIQSQRLLPGMQNANLSFKQKTHKFFGSSKVPKLSFNLNIQYPAAVQLDNPRPIPIILEIQLLPERTSPSVENEHSIVINWVSMTLHQRTTVVAPSNLLYNYAHEDNHFEWLNLGLEKAFQDLESPLVISTAEKGENKCNIGEMLQLLLRSNGLSCNSRLLNNVSPVPDFTTYSIHHATVVEWKVSFSVAGETETVKASGAMRVIASA